MKEKIISDEGVSNRKLPIQSRSLPVVGGRIGCGKRQREPDPLALLVSKLDLSQQTTLHSDIPVVLDVDDDSGNARGSPGKTSGVDVPQVLEVELDGQLLRRKLCVVVEQDLKRMVERQGRLVLSLCDGVALANLKSKKNGLILSDCRFSGAWLLLLYCKLQVN